MAKTKARKSTRRRRKPTVRGPQSLLILHLHAEKLRHDGLHLGDAARLAAILSALGLGSSVEVHDADTLAELHQLLASFVLAERTFDVVVVVAHSNAKEIRIASDMVVDWAAFARYMEPIGPRRLLLVACRAGRSDAGEALFKANARLRRIYACPVNASKDFGALMLFAVPYVVAERRPKDKHVLWTQIATVAATGRQLREWRRTTDKGNPDSLVFDFIADAADPIAQVVPVAIGELVRSIFGPPQRGAQRTGS